MIFSFTLEDQLIKHYGLQVAIIVLLRMHFPTYLIHLSSVIVLTLLCNYRYLWALKTPDVGINFNDLLQLELKNCNLYALFYRICLSKFTVLIDSNSTL